MDFLLYLHIMVLLLVVFTPDETSSMSAEEKNQLREKVLEMFNHGYRSYMDYAYPADELMPLKCKGRYRNVEKSRGDVDDILGNYSLTLIDTLDTLVVLGDIEEFDRAVKLVINGVSFDNDVVVSVFEANIRVLGGLLGGHVMAKFLKSRKKGMDWYKDELLVKAKDIGYRLLPAFNTTTGMPYPRVNLKYGVKHVMSRTGSEKDTCTACAGTMILEFSALSRLSGEPIFEEKAHKAMDYLWQSRHRSSDLVGTVINIHNGDWVRRDSGVGAGIDSYYEYLLKAYILLGDETYLDRFNKHYAAIRKYVTQGPMLLDVHMHKPRTNSRNFMDALLAFWPGLQVLIGDMKPAIETHEMLYQVMQRHNFIPEAFTTDFRVHWAQHPLRPEFLESTYFLYKATGDNHYLDVGKQILENLENHARVKCGFAAIKDVTTGAHEDQMDSFVLAETFKYLYLLFAEPEDLVLDIDNFIFTTEAHLLPLSLSTHNSSQNGTRMPEIDQLYPLDEDERYERSCPNTNHVFETDYAKLFREPLKNLMDNACPAGQSKCKKPNQGAKFIQSPISSNTCNVKKARRFHKNMNIQKPDIIREAPKHHKISRRPRLRASEFMAGNKDQIDLLNKMGISVITMKDGRVQLLHTATDAANAEDADDGMAFMQEMIELSKNQVNDAQNEPCVVQFMAPSFVTVETLNAGPAQFGYDLKKNEEIRGGLIKASPYTACQSLDNEPDVHGKVVLMERGDCMFVDKARQIQGAGAIAGLVIDSHEGTSSSSQPLFAMSGDGHNDIVIPMLFLFHAEGQRLLDAYNKSPEMEVWLRHTPRNAEDLLLELLRDPAQKSRLETVTAATVGNNGPKPADVGTTYTTEKVVSGVKVKIRYTNAEDSSAKTETSTATEDSLTSSTTEAISGKESLVADVVAELTRHTNFDKLGKTSSYLSAIKKMMEAISKGNYHLVDAEALASLEELTQQLKPKAAKPELPMESPKEVEEEDEDDDEQRANKDKFTADMNAAIDTYIIQELQRVVDEAAGLLPKAGKGSDGLEADAESGSDLQESSEDSEKSNDRSYVSEAEILEEQDIPKQRESPVLEGGIYEKNGPRYLPPSVQQAPDWMEIGPDKVVMARDGNVYADLKSSYWDWTREGSSNQEAHDSSLPQREEDLAPLTSDSPESLSSSQTVSSSSSEERTQDDSKDEL